jgi:ABC-type lipoprotein release transport system permease subunit
MIIRSGIRSVLRSKKLCSLFFLLTALLSLLLSLGAGVFETAGATLASFKETYRTVGRLEYIGADYPDETVSDEEARAAYEALDPSVFLKTDGVLSAEKKQAAPGFTEGFKRFRAAIPYKDYGVLIMTSLHPLEKTLTAVPLEEEPVLPEVCVVEDKRTGSLTIYDHGKVKELLRFVYDRTKDIYTAFFRDGGRYLEYQAGFEDLPQDYLLYDSFRGRSELRGSTPVDLEDETLPRYLYDPDEGTWAQQFMAVSEYTGIFADALYSRREQRRILIRLKTGLLGFEPDESKTYAVHGSFVDAGTSNLVFEMREFSDDDEQPWLDVTGMDRAEIEKTVFGRYAQNYRYANNYLNVSFAEDITLLEPFHQGWLTLAEGRFPQPGEDHACVIDHTLADQLRLTAGDTLPLRILISEQDSLYRYTDIQEEELYTVTGIANENNDYHGEVFIQSSAESPAPFFGYTLGTILFDNEKARAAAEEIRLSLPSQVRLTIYDQGYETNSQPIKALQTAALIMTLISCFGALSVLVLFAFLYIYRQRETIDTLYRLGLKKSDTAVWMLSGILTIVLAGSAAGTLAGSLLMKRIVSMTVSGTASLYAMDTRFSEAAVGLTRSLETVTPSLLPVSLLCIGAVLVSAVLLSLFFLRLAMRASRPDRGRTNMKVPDDTTSTKGRGVLRYGRIACERGGSRSAAVILITFVLSLLLCGFSAMASGWEEELDDLYENTEITGGIVSLSGRYSSSLLIRESIVRLLNTSGYLESFHVSDNKHHYWLADEIPVFADTSFGRESRDAWIGRQPRLILTDSVEAAEDFFYSPAVIQWLDGYDETFLLQDMKKLGEDRVFDPETGTYVIEHPCPALMPARWLNAHGWQLGDVIEIVTGDMPVKLLAAGTFTEVSGRANIYIPLAAGYDLKYLYEERDPDTYWHSFSYEPVFTSGRFRLKSAEKLSAFKDFLEGMRFSQVNRPAYDRTCFLINDASFLETLSTLRRHIAFADMIYPVLMAFTILTGFLISWLMINGRRMDFAVMKGLGTGRFKVFMIFFLEQAYAALTGIVPSLILSFFIGRPLVILLFAAAYLCGTSLSILLASRENLMVLLSEKE